MGLENQVLIFFLSGRLRQAFTVFKPEINGKLLRIFKDMNKQLKLVVGHAILIRISMVLLLAWNKER